MGAHGAAILGNQSLSFQGGRIETPIVGQQDLCPVRYRQAMQGLDLSQVEAAWFFQQDPLGPRLDEGASGWRQLFDANRDNGRLRCGLRLEHLAQTTGFDWLPRRLLKPVGGCLASSDDGKWLLQCMQHLRIVLRHGAGANEPECHDVR